MADREYGTIVRTFGKGFGFIADVSKRELFFHATGVEGVKFDALEAGQQITFERSVDGKGKAVATAVQLA